ncbi:hypothetical protein VTH06DRAFT_8740 [Thermothelomyces fergusii]
MATIDISLIPHPTGAAASLAAQHSAPHPLRLYGGWFCPFVQRAWIVLVEKRIPHQYVEINPYKKEEVLLRLNPRGLVPTLAIGEEEEEEGEGEEGGRRPQGEKQRALYESTVICEYLDERFADEARHGPRLLPEGAYERARCRLWMHHVATRVVPAFYRLLQHTPDKGYAIGEARAELLGALREFAAEMAASGSGRDGPYFLGARFGLVDVMLAPWAKRLFLIDHYKPGGVGIPRRGERHPGGEGEEEVWARWHRWFDAVVERDSVRATWSDDDKYVEAYRRGHSCGITKIGRRNGRGPRPFEGKQRDGPDEFDFFDDFRVQGRQSHPKGKKSAKGGKGKGNRRKMGQEQSLALISDDTPPWTLAERSLDAVADLIKSGRVRRIAVMTGAGISTAAGIPDFRSPDTGLYANLAALDLPEPEAVFDLAFFRQNPRPFYALARELYPGARYRPTVSHAFVALLARRGLLHVLFTQNIDCLERAAGVPADLIVEAHGSFATQRCIDCRRPFPDDAMRAHVERGEAPRCGTAPGAGEGCGGLVKPDIVFFGEALPKLFFERSRAVQEADLVLVMGTSLQVYPFARLPNMAEEGVPRVLLNLERVGTFGTRADDVVIPLGEGRANEQRQIARAGPLFPGFAPLAARAPSRLYAPPPPPPPPPFPRQQKAYVPWDRDRNWACCGCGCANSRYEFLCWWCGAHSRGACCDDAREMV